MKTITIDGYLTQGKLEKALKEIVGPENWLGRETLVAEGSRFRWDMTYLSLNQNKTIVEFDGDGHYRDSLWIKRDHIKDKIAETQRAQVTRIPYWVQLTTETLAFYTGLEVNIVQTFPHGFITTKYFPASFCELGLHRFHTELEKLPQKIRIAVLDSLRDRCNEYGKEYVLPESMYVLTV